MKSISVYDDTYERIERICDKYGVSEYGAIDLLLENAEGEEDIIFM